MYTKDFIRGGGGGGGGGGGVVVTQRSKLLPFHIPFSTGKVTLL